jgi:hypothetical protein
MKDKRNIVEEYQQFCFNNRFVENSASASMFAEIYLNKDTKVNSQRIAMLYAYIETKE